MELLLSAQGCPNLESFAIRQSDFGHLEFGELFAHMSKLAPQLATLVISTDSASYDDAEWSIFRELPRSVKNLYLEFDDCHGSDANAIGESAIGENAIGEVLDLICEHISSDVLCHVLRPGGGSSISAYYLTLIKGLAESNGKLWTHPAFVSGRGSVR